MENSAAIIIPHCADTIRLSTLLRALVPQAGGVEILVVDNGAPSDLRDLAARYPQVRVLRAPVQGAAEARNFGAQATGAQRLWFLDADCVPAVDWVARAAALCGHADLVGGAVAVFHESAPLTGAQAFEQVFAFKNRDYIERKGFSVTANLLVTRAIFERVGGFRAGLSEDLAFCRAATALGGRLIHADDLRVSHPSRGDFAALARKWRRLTVEAAGLRGESLTTAARGALFLRAFAVAFSALAHLPRMILARDLSLGARGRGVCTLVRLRLLRAGWMLRQAVSGRISL